MNGWEKICKASRKIPHNNNNNNNETTAFVNSDKLNSNVIQSWIWYCYINRYALSLQSNRFFENLFANDSILKCTHNAAPIYILFESPRVLKFRLIGIILTRQYKTPPHSFHHITHPFSFVHRIKFNLIQRQLHANIHIQILCSPPFFTRVSLIHERSMAFLPDLLKSSHFSIPRGKFLTGHSNTHNFIYKYTYSCPLVLDFHCFNVSSSILIRILTVPTTINS